MPPVTILSPYSGRPVKVREQDLGRAIRDEEGRVFYIVEHPEFGRYAARTRKGSDKDLERYKQIESGNAKLDADPAVQASRSATVHDATGAKRRNPVGLLLLILILLLAAGGAYVYFVNPGLMGLDDADAPGEVEPSRDSEPTSALPMRAYRLQLAGNNAKPYADFSHTASGLRYKLTHRGDGPPAKSGTVVTVRYTAQSIEGESIVDDAMQSFVMMSGEAIRAFDEGLAGRRQGDQLRLLVPRGHSVTGRLAGIDRLPQGPYLMDVQVLAVKPGVSWVVEQPGKAELDAAGPGDKVSIHYVLRVEGREEVVDATSVRGEPMTFTLGSGEVIRGLDLGLVGMRPGGSRTLTIPPYLAYGEHEVAGGLIPANAVLSFRIFMVNVERPE